MSRPAPGPAPAPEERRLVRAVAAACVGNALEWFDFSSYAFFATYISAAFFAEGDPASALVATFLVFGAGFLARPLGALVLGAYGDTHGRAAALTATIAVMAAGTAVIAVAPPFAVAGIGAPLLLLAGRLLQGFSAGGEIGGAASYLVEQAPAHRRASLTAWLQASMGASNILSALLGVAVTSLFTAEQVGAWAWRVPFVVGLVIVPVGLVIRRSLDETPQFRALADDGAPRTPVRTVLREHPRRLLLAVLACIPWQVSTYALIIYATSYYTSPSGGLGFTAHEAFVAVLVGNLVFVAACLLGGRLADGHGIGPVLRGASLLLLVVPTPALVVLHAVPSAGALVVVQSVLCLCAGALVGPLPSLVTRIFPPQVRSTGLAIAYNVAAVFFAGFTPALMAWATRYTVYAPGLYVAGCAVLSLLTLPAVLRLVAADERDDAARTTAQASLALVR